MLLQNHCLDNEAVIKIFDKLIFETVISLLLVSYNYRDGRRKEYYDSRDQPGTIG